MLALSRKVGEVIIISGNIKIKVLETREGKVRLGIDAPKEISVYREELLEKIKRNQGGRNDTRNGV
jgi:carbon storage regulator